MTSLNLFLTSLLDLDADQVLNSFYSFLILLSLI